MIPEANAVLGLPSGAYGTIGVIALGAAPIGALLAGLLGEMFGLQATLAVGVLGLQLGFAVLLLSPLHTLRQPPPPHAFERLP